MNPTTTKPTSITLLKWLAFDSVFLKEYSQKLTTKENLKLLLKVYLHIVICAIIVLFVCGIVIIWFDLSKHYSEHPWTHFFTDWQKKPLFLDKLFVYCSELFENLFTLLIISLVIGITGNLIGGLVGSLTDGLASILTSGLVFILAFTLTFILVFTSAFVCSENLYLNFKLLDILLLGLTRFLLVASFRLWGFDISKVYILGLIVDLVFGLFTILILGLLINVAFGLLLYLLYSRIIFYPYWLVSGIRKTTFSENPYRHDGFIWLPLPSINSELIRQTKEMPDESEEFIEFLLQYRPLQKGLAMRLEHAANAGMWLQTTTLSNHAMAQPYIVEDMKRYKPSPQWYILLDEINSKNDTTFEQNNIGLRLKFFEEYCQLLKEFRGLNFREAFKGREHYTEAIDHLLRIANEDLIKLKHEAKSKMPISINPFRKGNALFPDSTRHIFKGRNREKDELSVKVLTSTEMPMLLIQGQRRVGKTSLLNFLNVLLDRTRFTVVKTDLQETSLYKSIPLWLAATRQEFNKALGLKETSAWQPPSNWAVAWQDFSNYVLEKSENIKQKVIIAIDEYEYLHRLLQHDPAQGEDLLANMRSFCQKQNRITFLFSGFSMFSDLENPHWAKYFVNTVRIKLDYLSQGESLELILKPTPEFSLKYQDGLPELIFEQTQGHPHLIHNICSELVDIANRDGKPSVTLDDYNSLLKGNFLDKDEQPFANFWAEFCSTPEMKATVIAIANDQQPTHTPSIRRLLDYAYITENSGNYNIRVPLFEAWLKKNAFI